MRLPPSFCRVIQLLTSKSSNCLSQQAQESDDKTVRFSFVCSSVAQEAFFSSTPLHNNRYGILFLGRTGSSIVGDDFKLLQIAC
jgi:hypothetical protein